MGCSTLDAVTSDLLPLAITFCGGIAVRGTDVSMYRTELHAVNMVNVPLDGTVTGGRAVGHRVSLARVDELDNSVVCELTSVVSRSGGTVPINGVSGTRYGAVYIPGVIHNAVYGSVNGTASFHSTVPNWDCDVVVVVCHEESVSPAGKIDSE